METFCLACVDAYRAIPSNTGPCPPGLFLCKRCHYAYQAGQSELAPVRGPARRDLLATIAGNVAAGMIHVMAETMGDEADLDEADRALTEASVNLATAILAEVDRRAGEK